MPTLNELGKTLLGQLYSIVTGGDGNVPKSPDTFVSWCTPGIPFQEQDFNFCWKGLGGGANAEEEKLLVQQAFNFANFIDFIPKVNGTYDGDQQQKIWTSSEARLSHMYGEILRFSKVVATDLTDDQKKKLEKFRKLLRTTKKVKDLVTDEEKEVTEDGPMLRAYQEHMAAYIGARLEYNNKRIAAQAATGEVGKKDVVDWSNNQPLYALKVKAAMDAWTAGGYRNDVDDINAYINQTTMRSMKLWKQRLLEMFDDAHLAGLGAGQQFYFSTLIPGKFATSAGWTNFKVEHGHVASSSSWSNNSWDVGGGLNFGLFSIGGGLEGSSSQYKSDFNVDNFTMSFDLAQVVISRPWFYPEFFMNRGWTLRTGEGWTYPQMPSDGKFPQPSGLMIAYPTTVLFARNIVISSAQFASAFETHKSSIGGKVGVGWGPFFIGGSYRHEEGGTSYDTTTDGQSIRVPGLQIIGFLNHLIPKAPDPLPELKPENFQ